MPVQAAENSSTLNVTDRVRAPADRAMEIIGQAAAMVENALELSDESVTLSIIIPVFNEPATVLEIVERVRSLPFDKQIIVVNDGSHDDTATALASLKDVAGIQVIHHAVNSGKGAALRTGFGHARGKFVIVQDADLEYDPAEIPAVIQPLIEGRADAVYGSRYLASRHTGSSPVHRFGNWLLTQLSNRFTGYRLTDMETCYKAVRRDLLQKIDIEQNRFGFEPEITAKLAQHRARVIEVPITYHGRGWDQGKKIGWRDLCSTLYCIIRYSFQSQKRCRSSPSIPNRS